MNLPDMGPQSQSTDDSAPASLPSPSRPEQRPRTPSTSEQEEDDEDEQSDNSIGFDHKYLEDMTDAILQRVNDVKNMLAPIEEPLERGRQRRRDLGLRLQQPDWAIWRFRVESSIVLIVLVGLFVGVLVNLFYIGLIFGWLWAHYDWAGWDA
ncbi:hypothetical protein BDW74DRAFT_173433 [Aspergillus multicolor]|uniref:uncharacterized protein n=1 Tax=Aspergillus multicolor TaxID=41759 RepID=UPI003CCE3D9A